MFRWLMVCLALCVGTYVLMNMALGDKGMSLLRMSGLTRTEDPKEPVEGKANGRAKRSDDDRGVRFQPSADRVNGMPPLVIYDARIQVINKQDVSAEHEGILLFFGTELRQSEPNDPGLQKLRQEGKLIEEPLGYLVVKESQPERCPADELLVFPDNKQDKYRRYRRGMDVLDPNTLRVANVSQLFRKLEVGDRVSAGDLLALVKPTLALEDLNIKVGKYLAAEADRIAAEKTRDEAKNRWDAMTKSRQAYRASVSDDDWRGARLTFERYVQEQEAKLQARKQAESEIMAAETTVRMHEIRALCSGVVKLIYKNRGDAVKSLEPVLHIQDTSRLRVEGVVEVQDALNLDKNMPVSVEPTQLVAPQRPLRGHTQEVTCVAVSKAPKMWIVSGSEDHSLRIWDRLTGQELGALVHPSAVRSVACTGNDSTRNLVITGSANGTVRLFNLDNLQEKCVEFGQAHQNAVTSVAFSPDGELCVTGGEDSSIVVWRLKNEGGIITPQKLHRESKAHRSSVTSVQFIVPPPASSDKAAPGVVKFLTVGRDGTAMEWTMKDDQAPERTQTFDHRSDSVAVLNTDGKRVLIDQNGELRLRSLNDNTRIEGRLRNPPGAANFTTMALFAPDGNTILTNIASENRLQLWRTPPSNGRGSEMRQMVWNGGTATCGAFAPNSSFVVTGTQDQAVLIWNMPGPKELDTPRLPARISLIEKSLDSSNRQVRIWADLENPPEWVVPGSNATMVIIPPSPGTGGR